jgi:hypothetical protein
MTARLSTSALTAMYALVWVPGISAVCAAKCRCVAEDCCQAGTAPPGRAEAEHGDQQEEERQHAELGTVHTRVHDGGGGQDHLEQLVPVEEREAQQFRFHPVVPGDPHDADYRQ